MKRILLSAMCAFAMTSAMAQTTTVEEKVEYSADKYKVETNRFWNNWFVSVGGGAQVYFGDHDKQADFADRLAPALDVAVGKWFTPGIGVRLMYSGLQIKGATQDVISTPAHSTGEDIPGKGGWDGGYLRHSKFNMGNIHADVLFNMSNLLCGYNEKRVWNCSPYAGIGFAMVYDKPFAHEVSGNVGVLNSFRLCDALSLNLDVRAMYVNERFDGEDGGRFGEGLLTTTIGLTYRFKDRGWNKSKTVYRTTYDYGDLEAMREKLNQMTAENERLKKSLAEGKVEEVRTIIKKIAAANLVTFPINKSNLTNEARVNLGMLAEIIKSGDSDVIYTITGYADAGTGSKKGNEKLSKDRAQAVYDCLVKEFSVNPSQLRIDHKGGVENMFYNDPRLSRAVITRSE